MPPVPAPVSRSIGVLSLVIGLLVLGRELHLWESAARLVVIPVILVVLVAIPYVSRSRRLFVTAAAALSAANLVWNQDWQATLTAGFVAASFIGAFFAALTTLKSAAETSPAIRRCGRFLAQQPPGTRYLALTLGGQLFGLLLNYGAISLLGSMSVSNAALEPNEEIRRHRIRRMLLAIQRGFISILPWSPLSFAIAISTTLIPGASWAQSALPGLVNGTLLAGVGWMLDTVFKPTLSSPLPPRQKPEGNWFAVMPLLLLLLLLVGLLAGTYLVTGIRVLALVMIVVPLLSMVWVFVQNFRQQPLRQLGRRVNGYLMVELPAFRGEMVLLMMAGFLGTVASPLLGSLMSALHIDLGVLPAWLILVVIVWFIPIVGQFGMNPILATSLIAPLLPGAAQLGISPTAIVTALTAGWILSGVSSPFTATTLLVGNFGGVSSTHVGQRWNGLYTILCATILSAWVVVYAIAF